MSFCPHRRSYTDQCPPCVEAHRARARETQRAAREERRAAGLCGRCGRAPAIKGKEKCVSCTTGPETRRPRRGRPEHPLAEEVVAAFHAGERPGAAAKRLGMGKESAYRALSVRGLWTRTPKASSTREGEAARA